jgi:CubicO group peptidase (beta-lactamase class C family)
MPADGVRGARRLAASLGACLRRGMMKARVALAFMLCTHPAALVALPRRRDDDTLAHADASWDRVREALDSFDLIDATLLTGVNSTSGAVLFQHSKGGVGELTGQAIWSATKWVAGAAILREVELGTVALDELVSARLGYWPTDPADTRSGITLRHLLGFASGYADITQTVGYVLPLACAVGDLQSCARGVLDTHAHEALPGTRVDYNSIHLTIAGAMVETAAGEPILRLIQRNVFDPAGMSDTRFTRPEAQGNPFIAGGLLSTPRDYLRFMGAYLRGELVSLATVDAMMSDAYPSAVNSGLLAIVAARYGLTNW